MSTLINKEDRTNIGHIFTNTYNELVRLSREYVLYLIIDIFKKSNIYSLISSRFVSVEDIIRELNFITQANMPIFWMVSYLKTFKILAVKQTDNISFFKISNKLPNINADKIIDSMLKIDRHVLPSILLLEKAADGYPDFFLGSKTAIDILITGDKMRLWSEYFNNNNSGYVVYNSFAALGLLNWMPRRAGIKIMEIGGGTGSASVFFFQELQKRGLISNIKEYIFSDISPIMLMAGNRTIIRQCPDIQMVQLKTINFNKSLLSQGIKPESLDVIYGVNSIHAAEDLSHTLENIYNVLKPGGMLILSECVRPNVNGLLFQELIFNLFDNYRGVKLSELRPMPGFLDIKSWKNIFRNAGFKKIESLTNVDAVKKTDNYNDDAFAMIIKGEKSV